MSCKDDAEDALIFLLVWLFRRIGPLSSEIGRKKTMLVCDASKGWEWMKVRFNGVNQTARMGWKRSCYGFGAVIAKGRPCVA